ncbi:MAG: tRNA lysidine(34) synthetase TilS [Gammaproteobacteria bacterium]
MKLSSDFIRQTLDPFTQAEQFLVAYSGGVDSLVLLHLCASCPEFKRKTVAVHVHHGLQPEADAWCRHCAETSEKLGVDFALLRVDASPGRGESPEEAARDARYSALRSIMNAGNLLLTAQHRGDQAETILLQMFRGAGLAGLSGMPMEMPFGKGRLVRPLLDVSRDAIEAYAVSRRLQWVEDPSNRSDDYDRNYLRRRIMPLLKARWPAVETTIGRSGRHCAQAARLIGSVTDGPYEEICDPVDNTLSIPLLKTLERDIQQLIVRRWLESAAVRMPSEKQLDTILRELVCARADGNPELRLPEFTIRRYRDQMHVMKKLPTIDAESAYIWEKGLKTLDLPGNGMLCIEDTRLPGISQAAWLSHKVTVRYRKGGENLLLPGRNGRRSLKKLYQEAGIPPWERERMPLIYMGDRLAAVGDRWIDADFYGGMPGDNLRIQWRRRDKLSGKDHD